MAAPEAPVLKARCAFCETLLTLSPGELRTDAGLVRCTGCGQQFNAAWNLVDQIPNPARISNASGAISKTALDPKDSEADAPSTPQESEHSRYLGLGRIESLTSDADPYLRFGGRAEPRLNVISEEAPPQQREKSNTRPAHVTAIKKAAIWPWIGVVTAALMLFVQGRFMLLEELSNVASTRPFVAMLCRHTGCDLPKPIDGPTVTVTRSSIDLHRTKPEALVIRVHLFNHSHIAKTYPALEISLNGPSGEILGRRTYLPREFGVSDNDQEIASGREVMVTLILANVEPGISGLTARAVRS